ncbi:hypothetical protein EZV62_022584 [Acer yangbiense]|uniref:DUF4283 domain-containing protein n=1 Tax=Acer yangbiense TaxID=1000413 RepID=A0A5C7HA94_9ROSI|nr:hypothetical protein EZV62_022584 [Acer yangbiense]
MCASLSLMEKEGPIRRLNEDLKQAGVHLMSFSLVEKILANKQINWEEDKIKVLKGGPWRFDDALMVLEELEGKGDIKSMLFNKVLGSILGKVKEVDGGDSSVWMGKFLWVRVEIEIDKPLCRCLCNDMLGYGEETVISLQSERLPDFCF